MEKEENIEVVYFDGFGNIVSEADAIKCVVRVSDSSGKLIREVFGKIEKTADEEPKGMGSI